MAAMTTSLTLCLSVLLSNLDSVFSAVYIHDMGNGKMVELSGFGKLCRVHSDRDKVQDMLYKSDPRSVRRMSSSEVNEILDACSEAEQTNRQGGFIYPGTKWCGPGFIAQGYNDLGVKTDEDRCCREHDHCPNNLEPGQCRQGICNMSPFTRSHCDCDMRFRRCLQQVNTDTANTIGAIYFNIAQVSCFKDRRSCPPWMKADASYSWFCDEWKFRLSGKYFPPENITILTTVGTTTTEIKSKIDKDLENLYGKSSVNEKIMENGHQHNRVVKRDRKSIHENIYRNIRGIVPFVTYEETM